MTLIRRPFIDAGAFYRVAVRLPNKRIRWRRISKVCKKADTGCTQRCKAFRFGDLPINCIRKEVYRRKHEKNLGGPR